MSEYVLDMRNVTKVFPGVKALDNVSFNLKPGEIHALMGENGAGKSTFIKVIAGVHQPEEGEIYLEGNKISFDNTKEAKEAGIATIYQHSTIYPELTVTENIFIGDEITGKFNNIKWNEMNDRANQLLASLNASFDARQLMGSLSVAQQQNG